ncbi:MAG TPA: DUF2064 domain-containing protein [Mycobacteriales bacterium]|nr:DUF2064 domain-containing protein [Mycobacteriales bacterium]
MTPVMVGAVLVTPASSARGSAPPGVDVSAWWRALVEDTQDVVAALTSVRPAVAVAAPVDAEAVRALTWPGTPIVRLPAGLDPALHLVTTLDALGALGAELAVVLAADAPDLPGMLVGKLFSALEDAPLAVSPARGGGLCGLGARLPLPEWLRAARIDLDQADALDRLHAAAPAGGVVVGPGWHRLRSPTDIRHLDASLEGWDATRALLSGR